MEEQLNEIVAGVWTVAEALRLQTLAREEERQRLLGTRRRHEEEERLRKLEEARQGSLEAASDSWIKSQKLQEFLKAYEDLIPSNDGQILIDTPEDRWLVWAHRHTEQEKICILLRQKAQNMLLDEP